MDDKKSFEQPLVKFSTLQITLLIAILLGMILFPRYGTVYAQPEDEMEYQINLKSRTFIPQPGIKSLLRDSLKLQLKRGEHRHVFLQLKRNLDKKEQSKLEEQGTKILTYIGAYSSYATIIDHPVLDFTIPDTIKRIPILGTIRWIGEILIEDKIEPKIREEGVGDYNRNPDGTVDVVVVFFSDVTTANLYNIAGKYGQVVTKPGILNDIVLRLLESNINRLASEDIVKWIEELGPEDEIHNDGSRGCINVNPLQVAPYNLDGTNVQVGEWDGGEIDDTHDDLAGRVTIVEAVGVNDHATHVAGTLGGDGSRSAAHGGTANQWRGMATATTFFSYSFVSDDLEPEEHNGAINTHGIDLSQNSWGKLGYYGDYRSRSAKYDRIVCGIYGRPIPVIFSAGNSGASGFTTVTPPGGTAKNVIVVGAVHSDTQGNCSFSSRGPTDNEQTKPDIVAPGDESGIPEIYSTIPTDTYGNINGTSMAAPAVSGTIALMLQQYRLTFFDDASRDEAPLPSTFKVILCHTAEDLIVNPGGGSNLVGPDYVYGYGLINANEAVDAIRDEHFREGSIASAAEVDTYTIDVESGEAELRVTLAWDDSAGTPSAMDILQNDLDLLVVNPSNNAFYPPWELDPASPGTPASRNSYATEALANSHRDDVNVVEQIRVTSPVAGVWTIKVKASDLPFPGQRYSLICSPPLAEPVNCTCKCSASGATGSPKVAWIMIAPVAIALIWRWRIKRKQEKK